MNLLRKLLFPLGIVYWVITFFRNKCYDWSWISSQSYAIPVIAIGNLSVGGTGKTPHTEFLIRLLKNQYKLAVLSRGYKRKSKGFVIANSSVSAEILGDESYQIYTKFPEVKVAVCEDRRTGILHLLEHEQLQVILLDDAYQHRKVQAGFYVLLTAYDDLFADDFILPFGNLREPSIGKKRADVVLVTKCPINLSDKEKSTIVKKLNVNVDVYFTTIMYDEEVYSEEGNELLQSFKNKEKVVVVGIAKPNYFIEKVKNDKDHIKVYPDHHNFTDAEIAELNNWSKTHPIITTEKDYVRLKGKIKQNLYYLPIKIKFLENEFSFTNKIKKYVESSTRNSSLFKK